MTDTRAQLYAAARDLYMAAKWTTDTVPEAKQTELWEALRDALGFPAGTATAQLAAHTCCWHDVLGLTSNTFQTVQRRCCHCGIIFTTATVPITAPAHGPYAPGFAPGYPITSTTAFDPTAGCACRPENGGNGICGCVLSSPSWHKTDG